MDALTQEFLKYIKSCKLLPNRNPKYGDFCLKNQKNELPTNLASFIKTNKIRHNLNINLSLELKFALIQHLSTINQSGEDGVIIEYSSPNANKPLHIGHLRNNLLGQSLSNLIPRSATRNLINDRGIHICKSLIEYMKLSSEERTAKPGDQVAGDCYVKFCNAVKSDPELLTKAQELLVKWESGDPKVHSEWLEMRNQVCLGFQSTYDLYQTRFSKWEYESENYLKGKKVVMSHPLFKRAEDGSYRVYYEDIGLPPNGKSTYSTVLRADGTSIYLTQDIGIALERIDTLSPRKLIYVVADEQKQHFKVLFAILYKIRPKLTTELVHYSYGMIFLNSGRLKSRTGQTVDAADLLSDVTKLVKTTHDTDPETSQKIALAAIKYQFLRPKPEKPVKFNPEESVKLQGDTGPYLQYTNARINSLVKKTSIEPSVAVNKLSTVLENELLNEIFYGWYSLYLNQQLSVPSPASVCQVAYCLCRAINKFYVDHLIVAIQETQPELASQRLNLLLTAQNLLNHCCDQVGIPLLDKM